MANSFNFKTHTDISFPSEELKQMKSHLFGNINIANQGGVAAATDLSGPAGGYYYHWERDGALTMLGIQAFESFHVYKPLIEKYVNFTVKTQGTDNLDEPKFELPNGEVFPYPWARPQNDGAALISIALLIYANTLITHCETEYLTILWPVIKHNLNYICESWDKDTFDAWEEVQNTDFFWNRIIMRRALLFGSRLASHQNECELSVTYLDLAIKIQSLFLESHWTGKALIESNNRPYDSLVISGLVNGYNQDSFLYPTSFEIASTVNEYNIMFTQYNINTQDTENNIGGILYGRYNGDTYQGGNPWVPMTTTLAMLLYNAAIYVHDGNIPSKHEMTMWHTALNVPHDIACTMKIENIFVAAGDSVLGRVKYHISGNDGILYEEINKENGYPTGNQNLSASYASFFRCLKVREDISKWHNC